jgi:uracil-DNA glycosylase
LQPRKPLLLGEMPSAPGDRFYWAPLSGAPAARLSVWAGLEREGDEAWYWTLTRAYDTMNARERHGPWSLPEAQGRWAEYMLKEVPEGERLTVVCLGRRAAEAIGARVAGDVEYSGWGEWHEVGLLQYAIIPHPSGRNRLYNDKAMKLLAQRVLREARELVEGDGARIEDGRVCGPVR